MLNGAKFSYGHLESYILFKLLNNELQTILIVTKLKNIITWDLFNKSQSNHLVMVLTSLLTLKITSCQSINS